MVNVAIHEKYVQTLETFGNLPETIEKAIQCYTVEKITEKITEFQQKVKQYQAQYGMDYSSFEQRIAQDEEFVEHIEKDVNSTWEIDFADWEFCYKGIQDWTRKLNTILLT